MPTWVVMRQAHCELCMNADIEAHANMCGHAAGSSRTIMICAYAYIDHTRESMPAVCSSSTSVVLKTGYSHVLCMAPYTSRHTCWYGCGGGETGTVHHVGIPCRQAGSMNIVSLQCKGAVHSGVRSKWHDAQLDAVMQARCVRHMLQSVRAMCLVCWILTIAAGCRQTAASEA